MADLDTPLLARLQPVVTELNVSGDADALSDRTGSRWTAAYETASDFGERPSLDSLGPFRWHPYLAPEFVVCTPEQTDVRLKHFAGRPTIVIFYLGFGCLHCVEQLHAFAPRTAEFRKAGIQLMAISSEDVESLNTGLASLGSESLQIPLHADPQLAAFKAYRCFDDFEQQPLHGTFLFGISRSCAVARYRLRAIHGRRLLAKRIPAIARTPRFVSNTLIPWSASSSRSFGLECSRQQRNAGGESQVGSNRVVAVGCSRCGLFSRPALE